jgi:hypothetical protein
MDSPRHFLLIFPNGVQSFLANFRSENATDANSLSKRVWRRNACTKITTVPYAKKTLFPLPIG